MTSVEKRAVRDAALKAGAKEAYLIEEPLAAAIGANVPISGPSGNMIIDIGGGTSEIAVIALGGIVVSHSLRVGGNRFDESIATYIRKKYNLMVGERTAEEVKIQIGTALPLDRELTMEVRGRDLIAGLPRTIPITSSEVMEAIEAPLQQLVAAVRSVLEQTPPELSSDIIDKGMVMSGGGALLRNVDKLLTQVTGVPCHVAENPLSCVALGTGLALEHFDFFKKSLVQQIVMSVPTAIGETGRAGFVDLHCHTRGSFDCLSAPKDVVKAAHARGLTHLAITDHDRIDVALEARELAPAGLTIIVGEEVKTARRRPHLPLPRAGHPARACPPRRRSPRPASRAAWSGMPASVRPDARLHPARRSRWRTSRGAVDWIETHNARLVGKRQRAGRRVRARARPARRRGLRCALDHGGRGRLCRARRRPIDTGRAAGRTGRPLEIVPGRATYFVRLWTPLAKGVNRVRGNGRVAPAEVLAGPPDRDGVA